MKPIELANLHHVVKAKLQEQEEAEKLSQKRVTKWIKTRVRKLEQERKT